MAMSLNRQEMNNHSRVAVLLAFCFATAALAQTSPAFTYQGRLTDTSGVPPNGVYDFRFRLLDASSSQVGAPITNTVTVRDGLFATSLDFGFSVFDGSSRSIEISVRTNGAPAFVLLSVPQPITVTPYAIRAHDAGAAAIANVANTVPAGAITTVMLASNAVTSDRLATGAVTTTTIATGAITTGKFAPTVVSGTLYPSNFSAGVLASAAFPTGFGGSTPITFTTTNVTTDSSSPTGFTARAIFTVTSVSNVLFSDASSLAAVNGALAAAFTVPDDNALVYASALDATAASGWTFTTLTNGVAIYDISLKEVNGLPAMAFVRLDSTFSTQQLVFAYASDVRGTSSWNEVIVASTGSNTQQSISGTSLEIINGVPAIAYLLLLNETNSTAPLKFAYANNAQGSNAWNVVALPLPEASWKPSLALVGGRPAISFPTTNLLYAVANDAQGTGAWTVRTIDAQASFDSSLRVVNGRPAMSYFGPGYLRYAYGSDAFGTNTWTIVNVDTNSSAGLFSYLDVVNGVPAIAYRSGSGAARVLKYAFALDPQGAAWRNVIINSIDGQQFSIANIQGVPCVFFGGPGINSGYKLAAVRLPATIGWTTAMPDVAPITVARAAELAPNSVNTSVIANGAVTEEKLDGAVSNKLNAPITAARIASGAVTEDKLDPAFATWLARLDADQWFIGVNRFIDPNNIFSGNGSGLTALDGLNLQNGSVTADKLDPAFRSTLPRLGSNQTFTGAVTLAAPGAPFAVGSTNRVTWLNADLLDGLDSAAFATALHTHSASEIVSGTLADVRLSANVARLDAIQLFTGANTFTDANGTFSGTFKGNGFLITNLSASAIALGTIPDARLSNNVARLNAGQTFTGTNLFTNTTTFSGPVGIGTNAPQSALHVKGTVSADALRATGAGINTGTFAFVHRAVATNTFANVTTIYNSLTDGDPNAIVIITHNFTYDTNFVSAYNTNLTGVYYNGSRWTIYNEPTPSGAAASMALGRAFNVLVIKP
jgi:hypothetical protein